MRRYGDNVEELQVEDVAEKVIGEHLHVITILIMRMQMLDVCKQ